VSEQNDRLKYVIEVISVNLEQLIVINDALKKRIDVSDPEALENYLRNADATRKKILDLLEELDSILAPGAIVSVEYLKDLEALSGYYFMGGYKTDRDTLLKLKDRVNVDEYLRTVNLLSSEFGKLYSKLKEIEKKERREPLNPSK
jgi:hypothetical protein